MTTIETPKYKFSGLFFASRKFWLCNILGWFAFELAQSIRDSFEGSAVLANLIKYIPVTMLGIFGGLCIHFFYQQLKWYKRHPVQLVPVAALIAIIFGCINVFINLFDIAINLPEICYRDYPRTPNSCGRITDLFSQTMGAMLIWCLFYFLIQAERKMQAALMFNSGDAIKAMFILLLLKHIDFFLGTIAYVEWGSTYYLFSGNYFFSSAVGILVIILFSSYIFFINPNKIIFESQTLPLIPTLCVMSFFCAALAIGAESTFSRLYYLYSIDYDFSKLDIYHAILGSNYGIFKSKGQLAGTLEGGFVNNLMIALLFIAYRTPHTFKVKSEMRRDFNIKNSIIFWSYSFLFWSFFGFILYGTDLMNLTPLGKSVPLISTLSFAGVGIFIGAILYAQADYFAVTRTAPLTLVLKILFTSVFMGLVLTSALWLINYIFIFVVLNKYELEQYTNFINSYNYVFASIFASCVLCGLWSFICYMIESQHLQRDATIKQLQVEKNMKEVQLNALAGKVDPHFVFNALNNIRALIDEDSEKARSALVVLSDILRSPITHSLQKKVTIAEEMLLIRNYIALLKIQFEDRLVYVEDVSVDANLALIPSMTLQILVENAIKHGISQLTDGGVLSMQVHIIEQQLVCKVINHGSLLLNSRTSGFGVGIKVIRERLALLYGKNATFTLAAADDTVIAELILPIEIFL